MNQSELDELSAKALKWRWKSLWLPALAGRNNKPLAGVGICVQSYLSVDEPHGGVEVVPGRIMGAVIESPCGASFVGYSSYLDD